MLGIFPEASSHRWILFPYLRRWFQLFGGLVLSSFLLSACTTVNRGTVDHFFIDTVPQGATVTLSKTSKGEAISCASTPCAIKLPRRSEFIATITHPGYEPVELYVTNQAGRSGLAGSVATNTLVGGGTTVALGAGTAVVLGEVVTLGLGSGFAGTGAVAAIPPAAAVTGGFILIDVASGSTRNLLPNPVVIGLVPIGQKSGAVDPRVELYREQLTLRAAKKEACRKEYRLPYRGEACIAANDALEASRDALRLETRRIFAPPPSSEDEG